MSRKLTTKEFVEKARELHGDEYGYSGTKYTGALEAVIIICHRHGSFAQIASNHIRHRRPAGCPECWKEQQTKSIEEFIGEVQPIYPEHDFSGFVYINAHTAGRVICPEHGKYWQTPAHLLDGHGCSKCGYGCGGRSRIRSREDNIAKAEKRYAKKFDYSLVSDGVNNHTEITVICPEHGPKSTTWNSHLSGSTHGCPDCGFAEQLKKQRKYVGDIIAEFREKQSDKYFYDEDAIAAAYINAHTPIPISCPRHGVFWQSRHEHKKGLGCPICCESEGEMTIRVTLEQLGVRFKPQHRANPQDIRKRYDFAVWVAGILHLIEFHGPQHYKPGVWVNRNHVTSEAEFKEIQERDRIKKDFCDRNGIPLLVIPYREIENIKGLVSNLLGFTEAEAVTA